MVHSEVNDTQLVLVSARKSRGVDHWKKDDYDVRLGAAERTPTRYEIPLSFWSSVVTNDCKYVQCGSKDQDNSKQRGPHSALG
jgi:hypothetical protein